MQYALFSLTVYTVLLLINCLIGTKFFWLTMAVALPQNAHELLFKIFSDCLDVFTNSLNAVIKAEQLNSFLNNVLPMLFKIDQRGCGHSRKVQGRAFSPLKRPRNEHRWK
jgi:hypothetical protein